MRKHCWTGALCVLLCCACLAGCGLLDREYRVTKEHSDRYWESESADILRAESYDDVVSDLLILIGRHTESATLRLYQFPDAAAAAEALEQAALEVQQETALGAYAVEYITSELEPQPAYQTATIHLGYRRTEEQLQAIVSATSTAALPELLQITLESGRTELTVRIGYWGEGSAALARKAVLDARAEYGIGDDSPWLLCCYPNTEDVGILEFRLDGGGGTEAPENTLRFPDDGAADAAG